MIEHCSHVMLHNSDHHKQREDITVCSQGEAKEVIERPFTSQAPLKVLDMCCGSGAIAVSLLQECSWVCMSVINAV